MVVHSSRNQGRRGNRDHLQAILGDSSGNSQSGVLAPPVAPPEAGNGDSPIPIEESPDFLEIIDQNVTPFRTTPGHNMAFSATVGGTAIFVTMSVAETAWAGGTFSVDLVSGLVGSMAWSARWPGAAGPRHLQLLDHRRR